MNALLIALTAAALFGALYYGVALWRVVRALRSSPTARDGLDLPEPPGGWPSVCVIVPAHNEEDVIGALVDSLRAQDYPAMCVVLALDRCTDATQRIARERIGDDARFEVVEIDACPDDWAGKTHAAWSGLTRSRAAAGAELLLFTDADTRFAPGCVRASVALLRSRGLSFLSLLSTLTHSSWFEHLVQPSASLELMRQNPMDRVNAAHRSRAFANGQFMLFTREAYEQVGGHEAVRAALLEDMAFARALRERGIPRAVYTANGVLRCCMYRSWAQFRRGWKRIYTEVARHKAAYLRQAGIKLILAGVVLPLASLAALCVGAGAGGWAGWAAVGAGVAALAAWAAMHALVRRAQHAPLWTVLAAPLGSLLTALLLLEAAADVRKGRGITWAGRTYTPSPGRA